MDFFDWCNVPCTLSLMGLDPVGDAKFLFRGSMTSQRHHQALAPERIFLLHTETPLLIA